MIHSFFKHSRAANSEVGDWIWQKFKLIQAFMVVLVTCINEDQFKNENTSAHNISSIISLLRFFQTFKGSQLHRPWSNLAEF